MTSSIGAPFIPPDNTNLSISAAGALQLKPSTRGDLLVMGASAWGKLAKGSTGQVLVMGANDPAWTTSGTAEWIQLNAQAVSGGTTVTVGSLAAYDAYKVVVVAEKDGTSATDLLALRLNSDTAAHYNYHKLSVTTLTNNTGQTYIPFMPLGTSYRAYAELIITGKGGHDSLGSLGVVLSGGGNGSQGQTGSGDLYLDGTWWTATPSMQVTAISILTTGGGAWSGYIIIYGRNDLH